MSKYYNDTLPNGLRTVMIPIKTSPSVVIGVYIKVGSRYEESKNNGVAHFLEHMMFKGTNKYTSDKLVKTLDTLGAFYNAGTSHEYTYYYISGIPEHLKKFMFLLSDIYYNSTIPKKE